MRMNVPDFLHNLRQHVLPRIKDTEARLRVSIVPLEWCSMEDCFTPHDINDLMGLITRSIHMYGETFVHEDNFGTQHVIRVVVYKDELENESPTRIAYTLLHELAHVATLRGHDEKWVAMCKTLGICEIAYDGNQHPNRDTFKGGERFWDQALVKWIESNYE